jgi:hypothetical protein
MIITEENLDTLPQIQLHKDEADDYDYDFYF